MKLRSECSFTLKKVNIMTEELEPRKRRVRYKGTHPIKFKDKYKELNAEKYMKDVERVSVRRQTPAGTHVPICVNEILEFLYPKPGDVGLDATLGFGGHAIKLLEKIVPSGTLFAVDVDPIELPKTIKRITKAGFDSTQFNARKLNFAGVLKLLPELDGGFDFILADLGVSSMQIDNPERGFTFKTEGPLDLRLNPERGISAAQLIKKSDKKTIIDFLFNNSDEPYAEEIGKSIFEERENLETTTQLSWCIKNSLAKKVPSLKQKGVQKSLQRSFQAFRIAVNDELCVLNQFLYNIRWCLKPKGRIAILTFHSGEDRRVLSSFEEGYKKGIFESFSITPIRPSGDEQYYNPRSTSARLRWAVASENISDIMNGIC